MEQVSTITLIDDDPICHLISTKILKLFSSFTVETFTDAKEALVQLKGRASDANSKFPVYILLDVDMPRMNGWQFLEEFQNLPDHVLQKSCVIMLSSSDHFTDIEKSRQYKCVKHFLSKPLTEEKVRMIKQYCGEC
jgi:CheY-like chemotaxis protein